MIVKIAKWLILFIVIKTMAVLLISPFYIDPRLHIEARKSLCNAFKPNVVFIGTSRTLYGINPSLFDSLNNGQTRSYNFGLFSLSPEISFQIADDLILNEPEVKKIYIELSALDYSTVTLTPGTIFSDVAFRANAMAGCSGLDTSEKLKSFFQGLSTTLFQLFSIAPQITLVRKIMAPDNHPIEGKPEMRQNGHQSVALALSQTNDGILSNENASQQMLEKGKQSVPNTFYISRINQLIMRAGQLGKKVIFFYPNNFTKTESMILSEVAPYLPEQNLIRLPEDQQLTELFKPENLFDPHHLNQKGAAVYTRFLQKESLIRPNL
ncbi:hypothetical protein [Dyadobacter sp. CY323]|uniref:hypothetical protein n=1 Tax=Dyadobacter sp. CY323 TaxID=2907302 RepID=UPI001F2927E7|nr:hypothetical protein [Dyadobacter sp. CY323]MCE6988720.1 hypothetical protein [Dyadobacter sp. CY323]